MYKIYEVLNGYSENEDVYRLVVAQNPEEAELLARESFKEDATRDGYSEDYYTFLVVNYIRDFECIPQVIW